MLLVLVDLLPSRTSRFLHEEERDASIRLAQSRSQLPIASASEILVLHLRHRTGGGESTSGPAPWRRSKEITPEPETVKARTSEVVVRAVTCAVSSAPSWKYGRDAAIASA
jgi:hypothetical protein